MRTRSARQQATGKAYLWAVAALGWALAVYAAAANPGIAGMPLLWWFLGFLVMLEALVTRVTRVRGNTDFGAGTLLAFAALLLLGGAAAVVVFAWGSLVHGFARARQVTEPGSRWRSEGLKVLFNVGQASLSLLAPAGLLALLTSRPVLAPVPGGDLVPDLLTVVLTGAALFASNLALVTVAVALLQPAPLLRPMRSFLTHQGPVMVVLLVFAPVAAIVIEHAFELTPLLVVLLAALYLGARMFQQQRQQAQHDPLTELPNRLLFDSRLAEALEGSERGDGHAAVLIVDLDGFKAINDTHGHRTGDQVLRVIAQRLAGAVRASDTVARLGGDEFGVVLKGIGSAEDAATVADKVRQAFDEPVVVEALQVQAAASVGMAVCPHHGADPDSLLQHADATMYRAKRAEARASEPDDPEPRGRRHSARDRTLAP